MSHGHRHLTENDSTFTAKKRSTTEIIRRVSVYLWPYKWLALGTVGCAVLSLLCAFAFPRLTQYIIDVVIGDGQSDKLTPVILLLLSAFFLRDFFNSVRIQVNNHFEQNVVFDMRRDVYGRLQRLPVSYYDKRASGDLMTRVIEDVNLSVCPSSMTSSMINCVSRGKAKAQSSARTAQPTVASASHLYGQR